MVRDTVLLKEERELGLAVGAVSRYILVESLLRMATVMPQLGQAVKEDDSQVSMTWAWQWVCCQEGVGSPTGCLMSAKVLVCLRTTVLRLRRRGEENAIC